MKASELVKCEVVFDEAAHRYTYEGRELTGVTPLVSWMYPDTYEGVSDEVLHKAAARGSEIHEWCQMYNTLGITAEGHEIEEYIRLLLEKKLNPIDGEYLVTDYTDLASAVDVVFDDLSLGDIKTTSQIHYENVALQLNVYKYLFDSMNIATVPHLYVIWLPKKQYGECSIQELPIWESCFVCEIINAYKRGDDAAPYREKIRQMYAPQVIPEGVLSTSRRVKNIDDMIAQLKAQREQLLEGVLAAMREYDVKSWDTGLVKFTRLLPTVRKTVDSKLLQERHPDVYAECLKESETKESIKITIREIKN